MTPVLCAMGLITLIVGFFGSLPTRFPPEPAVLSPIMSFLLGMLEIAFLTGSIYANQLEDKLKDKNKLI